MNPVRILLVDDQPLLREGMRLLFDLDDRFAVIGEAATGSELIERLATDEGPLPDVVLMDIQMPEMDGVAATREVRRRFAGIQVIILTTFDDDEYVFEGLRAGACGYLLKDVPTDEIKLAIDTVMQGRQYLCTGAQGSIAPKEGEPREALTEREQTILLQLAAGKSNKEVAVALEISVRTVETHRKNIKRKLGISSTAGLTRYALEHGVLQGTGVRL